MNCAYCGTELPEKRRRDKIWCSNRCSALASYYRRKNGEPLPPRWQHSALTADDPLLRGAAARAAQLGETHGWGPWTLRNVLDGLATVLDGRSPNDKVPLSEVRAWPHRHVSRPRLAEVLSNLELLHDDSTLAVRYWIDRVISELAPGYAEPARQWLLVLLDGDSRARPRSEATLYAYFGLVRPMLQQWATNYGHLREVTRSDVRSALAPMRGFKRNNTIHALRSLFRFAKRRGMVFTNPTLGVKTPQVDPEMIPMTDEDIRIIEGLAVRPAERLAIALAAEHAARTNTIRHLLLADVDLPNRRIILAGHDQRLGDLTHQALRTWLDHRRSTWPHTPNPHVLISKRTALGTGSVSHPFVRFSLGGNGFSIDRIRADRILHEALTAGPDPLHLSLVFNLDHSTALRYATVAEHLLSDEVETPSSS
ncbi:integrase [Nocardia sp. NBC_00881]|uniref:integrase n=1 Tax=Nocardia sp. NBC_00881 TaxID=2975995 RepID=UPI0038650FA6|nr:integrase [Nocardia sp. NBC_00881]